MQIVALDGSPPVGTQMPAFLERVGQLLAERGYGWQMVALRERRIFQCRGCFQCWVRTPGECRIRDEMPAVLRAVITADLVIHASPLLMGFPSSLLRRATERQLPLLHPFVEVVEGEAHHRARYPRYPLWGLLLEVGDSDIEDLATVERAYQRAALNMKSRLSFLATTASTPEEICYAIDGVQRLTSGGVRKHGTAAAPLPRGVPVDSGS